MSNPEMSAICRDEEGLAICEAMAELGPPDDYNQPEYSELWDRAMALSRAIAPPEVSACREKVNAYYAKPGNSCGGPLHIFLDDDNVEDENIAFCRAEADKYGDADGVAICDAVARWPERWRRMVCP